VGCEFSSTSEAKKKKEKIADEVSLSILVSNFDRSAVAEYRTAGGCAFIKGGYAVMRMRIRNTCRPVSWTGYTLVSYLPASLI
jgi:hypothetical protein